MRRRASAIPRDRSGRAGVVDETAPEARFGRSATPGLSSPELSHSRSRHCRACLCFGDDARVRSRAPLARSDLRFARPVRATGTFEINGSRSSGACVSSERHRRRVGRSLLAQTDRPAGRAPTIVFMPMRSRRPGRPHECSPSIAIVRRRLLRTHLLGDCERAQGPRHR
jgi:hypothetical protein